LDVTQQVDSYCSAGELVQLLGEASYVDDIRATDFEQYIAL
jgi:hypothetical protein